MDISRVVVIGATGNIGTALLRRLHRVPGLSIAGVARRHPDDTAAPYRSVDWHMIDVGDENAPAALEPVLRGADAVVYLAWALQPTHDIPVQERTDIGGLKNVLDASVRAGVAQVVVSSSVGTYRAADKHLRVDETWPHDGIPTATYSIHKARNEQILDRFEKEHPSIVVTRVRPGLVFQRPAATEIHNLFLGRFIPMRIVRWVGPLVLPLPYLFVFQCVHADDLADAFWRTIEQRATGAFNIAADPVLNPPRIAKVLGMRGAVRVPLRLVRSLVTVLWHSRLLPIDAGWVDIAAGVPVMRTDKARRVLGWEPEHTALEALGDLVDGMADTANVAASDPLRG